VRVRLFERGASVSAVAPFIASCAGAAVAVVSHAFAGSERGASAVVVVVVVVAASGHWRVRVHFF
jgi:hypothetical protein